MHICKETNKYGEKYEQQLTVASLSAKSLTKKRGHALIKVDSGITAKSRLAGQAEIQYQQCSCRVTTTQGSTFGIRRTQHTLQSEKSIYTCIFLE